MPTLVLSVSGARGIVDDGLDDSVVRHLARAYAGVIGEGTILIGRDSRPSGPRLGAAAVAALEESGHRALDLGIVPTPTVQVAVEHSDAAGGIIITASHNPPAWNALKFVGPQGRFLDGPHMQLLLEAFRASTAAGESGRESSARAGAVEEPLSGGASPMTAAGAAAIERHCDLILATVDVERIRAARLTVVADMVHGAGQVLLGPLLDKLGVRVVWIHGEPNGRLPEHPEPRREMLDPLRERVCAEGADFGFASDPDGDRCAIVLPDDTVGEEGTLPLCALGRFERGMRGTLVTNLSTSARLEAVAARYGAPVVRAPVGEANVVSRMLTEQACFGGEGNGGVIDPAVHLGRDAGVAAALLLDVEVRFGGARQTGRGGLREAWATIPPRAMIKEKLTLSEAARRGLWTRLIVLLGDPENTEDGLRWSWDDEWLHVRASGTEPIVRVMAEAGSEPNARARVEQVLAEAGRPDVAT